MLLHRTPSCDGGHLFLQEPDGTTFSVLTKWTDLASPDPHVAVAGGRARFRLPDLVALGDILAVMKEEEAR